MGVGGHSREAPGFLKKYQIRKLSTEPPLKAFPNKLTSLTSSNTSKRQEVQGLSHKLWIILGLNHSIVLLFLSLALPLMFPFLDSSCKQNSQTKTPFLSQNLPATSITFRVKSKPLQRPAGIMAWDPLLSLYPSIPMATVSSGGAWVGHWFSLPLGYHSPVLACLAFLHGCYHFQWCVLKHSRTGFD